MAKYYCSCARNVGLTGQCRHRRCGNEAHWAFCRQGMRVSFTGYAGAGKDLLSGQAGPGSSEGQR